MPDKPYADVSYSDLVGEALKNADLFLGEDKIEAARHQQLLSTQYQLLALLERQLGRIMDRLDRIIRDRGSAS